jgi:hypothetical protein
MVETSSVAHTFIFWETRHLVIEFWTRRVRARGVAVWREGVSSGWLFGRERNSPVRAAAEESMLRVFE